MIARLGGEIAPALTLTLTYADRARTTRSNTLTGPTAHTPALAATARQLLTGLGLQRARVRTIALRAERLRPAEDTARQRRRRGGRMRISGESAGHDENVSRGCPGRSRRPGRAAARRSGRRRGRHRWPGSARPRQYRDRVQLRSRASQRTYRQGRAVGMTEADERLRQVTADGAAQIVRDGLGHGVSVSSVQQAPRAHAPLRSS
ncbi:hypothetical protein GTX14_02810 [Streptomyces sp. SID4944]|nr:hypothetical protein [Streptomyces sp. SID4944]